jgi:hypothetical protein
MAKTPIPAELRWQVWERDNFTCRECGTRRNLSVDHIIPEVADGPMTLENLQTLCRSCNSRKGTAPYVRSRLVRERARRIALPPPASVRESRGLDESQPPEVMKLAELAAWLQVRDDRIQQWLKPADA